MLNGGETHLSWGSVVFFGHRNSSRSRRKTHFGAWAHLQAGPGLGTKAQPGAHACWPGVWSPGTLRFDYLLRKGVPGGRLGSLRSRKERFLLPDFGDFETREPTVNGSGRGHLPKEGRKWKNRAARLCLLCAAPDTASKPRASPRPRGQPYSAPPRHCPLPLQGNSAWQWAPLERAQLALRRCLTL